MMTLAGLNSYTGGTTIVLGTLQLGSTAALGSATAALAVNGGTLDLNGFNAAVNALSGGGTIMDVAGGGQDTLTVGNGGGGGAFSGMLQNGSGTVALVKTGAGTEVLSGTNTYTGGTFLNGGILNFVPSALPHSVSGSITFGGGTLQYAAGNTVDVSAAIAPIAAGQAAIIDTGTNNVAFNSPLSGSGGLTKAGLGTLSLNSANLFTGATTVRPARSTSAILQAVRCSTAT